MAFFAPGEFAHLFRTEEGRVDRAVWSRAASFLAAIFVATTGVWIAIAPFARRGLDGRGFFDPQAFVVNLYLLAYAFVVILLAISWVNLGAKRFRDRGLAPPVGLAGIFPLLALFDGAFHWLQPRLGGVFSASWLYVGDALVVAAFAWTLAMCCDLLPRRS
jgi:uncharacterized membrane protein YhaH (DUF805 family)